MVIFCSIIFQGKQNGNNDSMTSPVEDSTPAQKDVADKENSSPQMEASVTVTPADADVPAKITKTSASKYAAIASLDAEDEDEKWRERTSIITKFDHEMYKGYAKEILNEIVADVKTPEKEEKPSEAR